MTIAKYIENYDSGLAWLGAVPKHWSLKRLGHFFSERKEKVSDKDFQPLSVTKHGIVPRLETAAKTQDGDNRKRVIAGDFVINSRSDRKGSSGLSELDGSVSLICIVLEPNGVYGRFAHHLLRSEVFQEEFYRNGKGIVADLWSTGFSEMKNIVIPVPSHHEQTQIARFLDHETAKIDALIREQERLIELLQEKRQAVISHAVTKGLDPDVPMKDSGVEWLGEVPVHWEAARVKHVATFITSGPRGWSDFITEVSGDVFLQSGDLDDNLGLQLDTAKMVKPPAGAEGMRTKLKSGDVVVCITGANTGRVAVVEDLQRTTFINQHLSLIRTDVSQIDPRYLAFSLSSLPGRSYFDVVQYGLKEGLSLSNVSEAPIALPSVEEQELIVKTLNKLISKFNGLSKATSEKIALLKERRSALISAAVTGKIDVRNWQPPTDESAFDEEVRQAGMEVTA